MLTTFLTIATISGILLLLAFRFAFNRPARRENVYVCDICNAQDCVCRKKR